MRLGLCETCCCLWWPKSSVVVSTDHRTFFQMFSIYIILIHGSHGKIIVPIELISPFCQLKDSDNRDCSVSRASWYVWCVERDLDALERHQNHSNLKSGIVNVCLFWPNIPRCKNTRETQNAADQTATEQQKFQWMSQMYFCLSFSLFKNSTQTVVGTQVWSWKVSRDFLSYFWMFVSEICVMLYFAMWLYTTHCRTQSVVFILS